MRLSLDVKQDIVIAIGNEQLKTIKPELEFVAAFPTWIYHHAFTDRECRLIDEMPVKWKAHVERVAIPSSKLLGALSGNRPLYDAIFSMLHLFSGFAKRADAVGFEIRTRSYYAFHAQFVVRSTESVDLVDRIVPLSATARCNQHNDALDILRTNAAKALVDDKDKQEEIISTWQRIEEFVEALRSLARMVKDDIHTKRAAQAALPQFADIISDVCSNHELKQAKAKPSTVCAVLKRLGVECEDDE